MGRVQILWTYRCQKYERLLEVSQGSDVPVADSRRNTTDEIVEVRESLLPANGLYNVFVDLLGGVLAQAALFVCSFRNAGE
jgi:hypothetical protein